MELELARWRVINAEDMKSVSDGSNPRLCAARQKAVKEDGIGAVTGVQNLRPAGRWETLSDLRG